MTEPIVLIGGGGHCKACIEVIESTSYIIIGVIDKNAIGKGVLNYPVIGNDECLKELTTKKYRFLITIGQIQSADPRIMLFEKINGLGGIWATVVAPSALVSKHSSIGEGTIVMHQAMINAASAIGKNCIINNKALIEHDCLVDDHTHISTAAIVNGGCTIGKRVFVGSNAVIVHGVQIADNVVIGSGSVVTQNISESGIYAGNPVKKIR